LSLFIDQEKGRFKHVKIFGMLNQGIQKNMLQDELPSYINQYYVCEYCEEHKKGEKEKHKDCYRKNICRFYLETNGKNNFLSNQYNNKKYINNKRNDSYNKKDEWDYYRLKNLANESWNILGSIDRWANRYQLDAYPIYCRTLGYEINTFEENETFDHFEKYIKIFKDENSTLHISKEQMLILMRMEKYRWNAERSIAGWRYGEIRDNTHLIHPLIIPFQQVPDNEKEKDKDVIKNIPYILALGGYNLNNSI
jgi:hypothetical protein